MTNVAPDDGTRAAHELTGLPGDLAAIVDSADADELELRIGLQHDAWSDRSSCRSARRRRRELGKDTPSTAPSLLIDVGSLTLSPGSVPIFVGGDDGSVQITEMKFGLPLRSLARRLRKPTIWPASLIAVGVFHDGPADRLQLDRLVVLPQHGVARRETPDGLIANARDADDVASPC